MVEHSLDEILTLGEADKCDLSLLRLPARVNQGCVKWRVRPIKGAPQVDEAQGVVISWVRREKTPAAANAGQ